MSPLWIYHSRVRQPCNYVLPATKVGTCVIAFLCGCLLARTVKAFSQPLHPASLEALNPSLWPAVRIALHWVRTIGDIKGSFILSEHADDLPDLLPITLAHPTDWWATSWHWSNKVPKVRKVPGKKSDHTVGPGKILSTLSSQESGLPCEISMRARSLSQHNWHGRPIFPICLCGPPCSRHPWYVHSLDIRPQAFISWAHDIFTFFFPISTPLCGVPRRHVKLLWEELLWVDKSLIHCTYQGLFDVFTR